MKKMLLLALAALCVSAAQAVTITWNLTIAGPGGGNTNPGWVGIMLYEGTLTDLSSYSGDLFNGSTDGTLTSSTSDISVLTMSYGDGSSATYAEFTSGAQTVSVTTTFADDAVPSTLTFILYNDYNHSTDNGYGSLEKGYGLLTATYVQDVADGSTVDLTSTTLSWADHSTDATSPITVVVPEPTVLALLALGVAGIALRRRA